MTLAALLTAITTLSVFDLGEIETALEARKFALGIGRYSEAKIYLVRHLVSGIIAYVGSTIKPLQIRWGGHRGSFKSNPHSVWSKYVHDNGGPDQFAIELVEEYPCMSFDELLDKEREHIRKLNPVCNVIMRTSVDDVPAHVIMSKDENTVKYEEVQNITEAEYLQENSKFGLASYQKYWFDNISPFSKALDHSRSSQLFEGIVSDKRKREQFVWAILNLQPEWVQSLRECRWIRFQVSSQDEDTVSRVSDLAHDLGLSSVYEECVLTDAKLLQHKEALHTRMTGLKKQFKLRIRQAKEVNLATLRLSLGSILFAFCGVELETKRKRTSKGKKENGKRLYDDMYEFRLIIKDTFIKNVCDICTMNNK